MVFCRHRPCGQLAPFVAWLWFYENCYPPHRREHVLPDGTFELIIDLREQPRTLFDRENPQRRSTFRRGWLSGSHSGYIIIDALPGSSMIGVHFKPGGAAPFLGCPADDLRDRVAELEAIWGTCAWDLREQLLAARGCQAKFQRLEQFLLSRLARVPDPRPPRSISWALQRLLRQPDLPAIRSVVDELGISHKHFVAQFRRQVGLTPKLFCRIQRFQQVLSQIACRQTVEWADIACGCGYFDQAHFVKDFQSFAGLNPGAYLSHRLEDPNFVPLDDDR
jgi:AraC-like DNA-binding protein